MPGSSTGEFRPSARCVAADDVTELAHGLRERQRRIVFTNGCFDLLHVGHVRYLRQARELGDALVVGVNSDASVRQLKGPSRPLVPEAQRLEILASLRAVDYVTLFDELTPDRLIRALRPDIHVKGGDYREEDLPESSLVRELGGRTVILPLVEGVSTTVLAGRLREGPDG